MMRDRLPLVLYAGLWRAAWPLLRLLARFEARLPSRWLPSRRVLDSDPALPGQGLPTVWMHCASLGESKGLWALADSLLRHGASLSAGGPWRLLLTAVTAEGLAFLEGRASAAAAAATPGSGGPVLAVTLAPLDHPGRVDRFLAAHSVRHLILYEADLWPHFILRSRARGIPVDLVAARVTAKAFGRLRILRRAWSRLLDSLDWIQAQGREDAERLRTLTRRPVHQGADFKAAHHLSAVRAVRPGSGTSGVTRDRIAFLSLHLVELRILLPELPALMVRFPLTVFPRRPGEFRAFRDLLLPLGFVRHDGPGAEAARHVLVDALGRVGELLPACGSAFVGGSLFDGGCHNLWEPLRAGLALHTGPSLFAMETAAREARERGLLRILREPAEMRSWGLPAPGTAEACADLLAARMGELEESETAFRARVADAVSGFYLFSIPA